MTTLTSTKITGEAASTSATKPNTVTSFFNKAVAKGEAVVAEVEHEFKVAEEYLFNEFDLLRHNHFLMLLLGGMLWRLGAYIENPRNSDFARLAGTGVLYYGLPDAPLAQHSKTAVLAMAAAGPLANLANIRQYGQQRTLAIMAAILAIGYESPNQTLGLVSSAGIAFSSTVGGWLGQMLGAPGAALSDIVAMASWALLAQANVTTTTAAAAASSSSSAGGGGSKPILPGVPTPPSVVPAAAASGK